MRKLILSKDRNVALTLFNWQKDLEYAAKLHRQAESTVYDDFDTPQKTEELMYNRLSSGNTLAYSIWNLLDGEYKRCGLVYLTDMISEITATLHPVMDRQGYKEMLKKGIKVNVMKIASEMLIKHGFDFLKLQRITGSYLKRNKGAIKFCESLGFIREGVCRHASRVNGVPEDIVILGLIKEGRNG